MTTTTPGVTGGVDTHGQTHHAAVLDHLGRQLGDREFPTTPSGYRSLLSWVASHGQLERVGIEGTGTYGAALTRRLRAAGVQVVEVDRPDRKARRVQGKSDPLDAYSAARSVLKLLRSGQLDAAKFITHHFALPDILDAYDVFSRAAETAALKVVLTKS